MRKFLDKIFENKKLSIFIPIAVSFSLYLLFLLFGVEKDTYYLIIVTPIVSAFWFFGVFFVLYLQTKNKLCPEWFLNFFELLIAFSLGAYSIIGSILFIIGGCQSFTPAICVASITHSAVAWAHSKRTV